MEIRILAIKGDEYYIGGDVHGSVDAARQAAVDGLAGTPQGGDPDFIELVQVLGRFALRRELVLVPVGDAAVPPAGTATVEHTADLAPRRTKRTRPAVTPATTPEPADAPESPQEPAKAPGFPGYDVVEPVGELRAMVKAATLRTLADVPGARASVAWLTETLRASAEFAGIGRDQLVELVCEVTGGDEFASVGDVVEPVGELRAMVKAATLRTLADVPGARASVAWLTETLRASAEFSGLGRDRLVELVCEVTGGDEFASVGDLVCRQPVCGSCGAYAVPGGLSRQPGAGARCKLCFDAEQAATPTFCPLRLALDVPAEPVAPALGVTEQASADLAAVVGDPPAWHVDVAGPVNDTVVVTLNGKTYWQSYAGPRTAQRSALDLRAQLEAGADVSVMLSRFREGAPAQ